LEIENKSKELIVVQHFNYILTFTICNLKIDNNLSGLGNSKVNIINLNLAGPHR